MNSFLQGKKTLSVAPLRPFASAIPSAAGSATSMAARPPPAPPQANHSGPTVEVVKEGDKVVRLVVVCGCGERVEIECLYPAGS
jgi:hypothetical protein